MLEMQWISLLVAVIVALVLGIVIGRFVLSRDGGDRSTLRRQLDELKQQHQTYQINVTEHFNRTTELIEQLNNNYSQIQEHLNYGAEQFVKPEYKLDSARTGETRLEDLAPTAKKDEEDTSPRDYAPKNPDQEGTLSETYGLKRSDFLPDEDPSR